jgi:GT2 family glycosyltransferase
MKPLVSIIVLTWNGKQHLKTCLDSCLAQSYKNLEIIVVDNASTDGTCDYIRKNYPRINIITNGKNLGFAEGNNVGIRAAKGEWIFVLNNDTKLKKNCVEELYKAVKGKPSVGMASPKMHLWEKDIDTLGLQLSRKGYSYDIKKPGKNPVAPCGGAAFYSMEMLNKIKLKRDDGQYDYFDSDYFIYYEDLDLGLRGQLTGWKCMHAPYAELNHLHGATMGKFSSRQVFYGDRNRSWTLIKNYPALVFWKNFHWFLIVSVATLIKWALMGKIFPIINSKFSMILGLGKTLAKRKKIQKMRKISSKEFESFMV